MRAGLLGGELLVLRPRDLPSPRSDRGPKGMQWKSQFPVPPMRRVCAHPCRSTVGCAFWMAAVCPYHTAGFCPAQGREKLHTVPTPRYAI